MEDRASSISSGICSAGNVGDPGEGGEETGGVPLLTGEQIGKRARLKELLEHADRAVFFGGAGVSTESGIPDFRSADGVYHQEYRYRPEEVISRSFFLKHPDVFYDFYRSRMLFPDALPNRCHDRLAELEHDGHLAAVVTQNIDGLHQKAGSVNVLEVHGSVLRNHCMECGRAYPVERIVASKGVPRCDICGGIIKPDVVLYEEPLDGATVEASVSAIAEADVLVVAGTSLVVYPAAGFVNYFRGEHLVVVNLSSLSIDTDADMVIDAPVGEVFDW